MEHKNLSFEIKAVDYTGRTLEGFAAAFGNVDQVGDIIHPGTFRKTLSERGGKIKFLWQHDPTEPIGKLQEAREDARGLFVKAIISDTQRGRDALALLKDGAIGEMSIGYDTVKGGWDHSKSANGEVVRNLRALKLWEISLVTFPANEAAVVTGVKQQDVMPAEECQPIARAQELDEPLDQRRDFRGVGERQHQAPPLLRPERRVRERQAQLRVGVELGHERAQLVAQCEGARATCVRHLEQGAGVAPRERPGGPAHGVTPVARGACARAEFWLSGLASMARVLRASADHPKEALENNMALSKRSKAEPCQDLTTMGRAPALLARPTTRAPATRASSASTSASGTSSSRPPEVLRVIEQGPSRFLRPAPVLDARLERLPVRLQPRRLVLLGQLERPRQQRQRLELDLEREAALARDARGVANDEAIMKELGRLK